jgi:hypothetical protein
MGAPRPHHGRAVAQAVGLVGALRVVLRVAPVEIRRSVIRALWAINTFIVTAIAVGLTWTLIAGDRLSEDAFAAIALGSLAVAVVGALTAAVVVRRRVVSHMRWGFGPDGALRVWRPDGSLLYPDDDALQPPPPATEQPGA